jgi:Tfp pilus assembly PilM family ATPase
MSIRFVRKVRTLPLGVDVGTHHVRVALVERDAQDIPRLITVAVRPRGDELASILADAVSELPTRERRCVFGVGAPDAVLRTVQFPPMSRLERERAATFEAVRFIEYPIEDATVRIESHPHDPASHILGIARRSPLTNLTGVAKQAGLRCVAIDNVALALGRALPESDAVLDIGADGSSLIFLGDSLPLAQRLDRGGNHFTSAIAESLGIDFPAAEHRKRIHGLSGAGMLALEKFVEIVASSILRHRASGANIRRLTLIGNGSRLVDVLDALGTATAIPTSYATFESSVCQTLPPDVVRVAAPDWCTAYGLALWETVA